MKSKAKKLLGGVLLRSMEMSYKSYFSQIVQLVDLGTALQKRLSAKTGKSGYIRNAEARAMLERNYIEIVKEIGRAFELMVDASYAMIRATRKT